MNNKHLPFLLFSSAAFMCCIGCSHPSKDNTFLEKLNSVIQAKAKDINTCYDAVKVAGDAGYDLENYKFENTSYGFAFDIDAKQFVVMNGDKIVYSPSGYKDNENTYSYFKFTSSYDNTSIYSQYLVSGYKGTDVLVATTGLDMGSNNNIKKIIYNNSTLIDKDIVLNTKSDYLIIEGASDKIVHYGIANNAYVYGSGNQNSFDAHGSYSYFTPYSGNVVIKSLSSIDLFEIKEGNTPNVTVEPNANITVSLNAPNIPTYSDINYVEVNSYTDITNNDKKTSNGVPNFYRLESDVAFPAQDVAGSNWTVNNSFFLDINGHKILFTGNNKDVYKEDGDSTEYHIGICLDAESAGKNLNCFIIDSQPNLYERPSIELNDCSVIVAGGENYNSNLFITSGRIEDTRGSSEILKKSTNQPAVLVIGNTTTQGGNDRKSFGSTFSMYGGYIRNRKGANYDSSKTAFKCIQPRGKGATVNMVYGDLYSLHYCISGQGTSIGPNHDKIDQYGDTTVNITGGTFVGGTDVDESSEYNECYVPLFFPQGGNVFIEGGDFTGPTCLDAKCGQFKINGGVFHSTKKLEEDLKTGSTDGSVADGSVMLFESNNHYAGGDIKIEINDVTMKSDYGYISNIIKTDHNDKEGKYQNIYSKVEINHNSGNYAYGKDKGTHKNSEVDEEHGSISVTGGTWTHIE